MGRERQSSISGGAQAAAPRGAQGAGPAAPALQNSCVCDPRVCHWVIGKFLGDSATSSELNLEFCSRFMTRIHFPILASLRCGGDPAKGAL